jgi:hypothetical protein
MFSHPQLNYGENTGIWCRLLKSGVDWVNWLCTSSSNEVIWNKKRCEISTMNSSKKRIDIELIVNCSCTLSHSGVHQHVAFCSRLVCCSFYLSSVLTQGHWRYWLSYSNNTLTESGGAIHSQMHLKNRNIYCNIMFTPARDFLLETPWRIIIPNPNVNSHSLWSW